MASNPPQSPVPIQAHVSGNRRVTYIFSDGRTVTLHGTHPYRDNNPGNLRFVGRDGLARAQRAGAIGIDDTFAIFATPAAGEAALNAMIVRRGNEGQTLQSFLSLYAPAGENNLAGYLRAVTTALNAKPSDTLASLSTEQRSMLAETIKRTEGWGGRASQLSPPVEGRQVPPR